MNAIEEFFYEQAKQIGLHRIAVLALTDRTPDEAHKARLRVYADRLQREYVWTMDYAEMFATTNVL
jgi:hypothetical protein